MFRKNGRGPFAHADHADLGAAHNANLKMGNFALQRKGRKKTRASRA
jgi:hypothetical protein